MFDDYEKFKKDVLALTKIDLNYYKEKHIQRRIKSDCIGLHGDGRGNGRQSGEQHIIESDGTMIELTVLNFLKSQNIGGVGESVFMENPQKQDLEEFILIEKTGSEKVNHINRATIAIQSWSSSMYNAAKLNEEVKDAMEKIIEYTEISKCSLNSDYNFTDTKTKSYRYQAVFDLVF